ncbi:MAG TPA: hypothetical protein VMR31_07120 [Myxococcota bacterium]|nr:hypothetical protein [Myxococcota bacterium]
MRGPDAAVFAALAALLLCAAPARADDVDPKQKELDELYQAVDKLEQRIGELEKQGSSAPVGSSGAAAWADRVRISGSANLAYLDGAEYGLFSHGSLKLYDTRLFVDADLARDVHVGEATAIRDAGFTFEWNLYRIGYLQNNVGDVYVDLRGLGDQDWANLQVGRFQIPFGENYLRFGRGYPTDPFVALSAPPPWFWDEGVKLWGKALEGKASYAFSWTDGENAIGNVSNGSSQVSLKLAADPWEWLHLSVSGLRSGTIGSDTSPAMAAVWLGEMFPRAFGTGASVPSFYRGLAIAPGPNKLDGITILGGDAIFKLPDARLWLSYGGARINSAGIGTYDRDLLYWLAELVVQLRMISPQLAPLYVAARASGLGTYNANEGYLLDLRYSNVGYNMSALNVYALALGWPIGEFLTVKAEYAFQKIALVHGVTGDIREDASNGNFFGMEVGVHF